METFVIAVVSGLCSAAGAWGALEIRLRWMSSEIRRAHRRIDVHDRRAFGAVLNGGASDETR